jgi:hypothetical protein
MKTSRTGIDSFLRVSASRFSFVMMPRAYNLFIRDGCAAQNGILIERKKNRTLSTDILEGHVKLTWTQYKNPPDIPGVATQFVFNVQQPRHGHDDVQELVIADWPMTPAFAADVSSATLGS